MKRFWTLLLLGSCVAQAQTLRIGDGNVAPGGMVVVPASFVAGAGVVDFLLRFSYPTAVFDSTTMGLNGGTCARDEATGIVTVLPPASINPQATNTYCQITFTADPGAAFGAYPLTIQPISECSDSDGNTVTCVFDHGSITVQNVLGPTLGYAPQSGQTVSFMGPIVLGQDATALITVTPSGGTSGASSTLDSCNIVGGTSLVVDSSLPLVFSSGGNPQPLQLRCTAGAVAQNASLFCTESIAGSSTSQRGWSLFCPAGVPQDVFANGFE